MKLKYNPCGAHCNIAGSMYTWVLFDLIVHDPGKTFMGQVFQANFNMHHVFKKSILVEAAH